MPRALVLSLALILGVSPLLAHEASAADAKAKISLVEARKIALARVPGTIVHEKLKAKKHEHPIYLIKIQANGKPAPPIKKVEIDGDTGKILKVKDLAPKSDKKSDKTDD